MITVTLPPSAKAVRQFPWSASGAASGSMVAVEVGRPAGVPDVALPGEVFAAEHADVARPRRRTRATLIGRPPGGECSIGLRNRSMDAIRVPAKQECRWSPFPPAPNLAL